MTALAIERETPKMSADSPIPTKYNMPMKASSKVFQGGLVVLNAGFAVKGSTATGLVAAGKAMATVDNLTGANGDLSVAIEPGVFRFDNDAGDLLAQADVGADCYITDDHTVCKTATGKSRAGKLVAIDAFGAWVLIGIGL